MAAMSREPVLTPARGGAHLVHLLIICSQSLELDAKSQVRPNREALLPRHCDNGRAIVFKDLPSARRTQTLGAVSHNPQGASRDARLVAQDQRCSHAIASRAAASDVQTAKEIYFTEHIASNLLLYQSNRRLTDMVDLR